MRHLSKGQKKVLKDYARDGFFMLNEYGVLELKMYGNDIILMKQLERINDYETLYDDVNRLLNDLLFCNSKDEQVEKIEAFI